jgi:hypothetical protein
MQQSTRVLRAQRVVQAAIDAEDNAISAGRSEEAVGKHRRKPKHLPKVVANTTDPKSRIMPIRQAIRSSGGACQAAAAR